MAISFPGSPTLNQVYTYNGKAWKWNGTGWVIQPGSGLFQEVLVSGTNIKTINSQSLLGSGDLTLGPSSPLTTKGDIYAYSTTNDRLPAAVNGKILSTNSATATGLEWIDPPASSPLTTKGDLYSFSTVNARLGVGSNGTFLEADSAETTGLKWTQSTTVGKNLLTLTNPSAIRFIKINADNTIATEDATTYRMSLGATTVGANIFTLANPSAITFIKINADNTITTETASNYRTSIGATTVGSNLFTATNPSAITFPKINADNTITFEAASTHLTSVGAQAALVSGTNIKTVNGTTLLGSGDVAVQATLVSGTNIKTINSTSLLGSGDVTVQATLVSGTNIKTVDGTTLLGSGNIAIPFEICHTVLGTLTVGAGSVRWYVRENITIQNVYVHVSTAPTGASIIVDVNKNGSTIFTTQGNRPTIAISGFTDTSSTPDLTSASAGDYFTVDVDQIGSTIAGANLVVRIVAIKA